MAIPISRGVVGSKLPRAAGSTTPLEYFHVASDQEPSVKNLDPRVHVPSAISARFLRVVLLLICVTAVTACSSSPKAATMENAAATGSAMVGEKAPLFTLPNQDGKEVSLASMRNKWVVLYFYPRDDTPGCTCQASEFTNLLSNFHSLDATVIGVSPDPPADHIWFREKHGITITLLSDVNHRVMNEYGAWAAPRTGPGGHVVRSTFLINPAGRIAYHWPEVVPQGHAERVRQKLEELRGKK